MESLETSPSVLQELRYILRRLENASSHVALRFYHRTLHVAEWTNAPFCLGVWSYGALHMQCLVCIFTVKSP